MRSRTGNSLRNTIIGFLGLLISLVVSFATKSVFIKLLGAEYNGVNGLFTNILQVLNLAELGFAASIAYALYKPLKEKDEQTTAALMRYFAKIYRIIAIVVTATGACCIPFLQYLIAEDISTLPFTLDELRIYFTLYLVNTIFSYLLAYKRTIITADQDNYIISAVDNSCNIALNILQIALLLITHSYYAYLIIMIAKTIINNLIIHIIASKKYPYLSQYKNKLQIAEKKQIFRNVKAMFMHKLGYVAISGTTTIIISAFVGIVQSGIYGNYLMIVTQVNSFVFIVFTAITASVGNLCVNESKELQYIVFKRIQYVSDFFAVFALACFTCLFNPFIEVWLGKDMMFQMAIVVVISFNSYVTYFRKAVNTFRDAMGIFVLDWYKPLVEAVIGIALAIGLSYVWGTFGILFGYTLATVVTSLTIENIILFKYGLQRGLKRHFIEIAVVTIFACVLTAALYFLISLMPGGIGWFVLKLIVCVVVSTGAFFLATCWMPEFKYYKNLAFSIIKNTINKLKKGKTAEVVKETVSAGANKDVNRVSDDNIGSDETKYISQNNEDKGE